jgi:predicted transposase YdaD
MRELYLQTEFKEECMAEGRAEGKAQGLVEGKAEGRIEVLELLEQGLTIEEIKQRLE